LRSFGGWVVRSGSLLRVQARRGLTGVNASRVVLLPLVAVLDAERFDVDALLSSVGLTRQALTDPELRIPRELVGDLWRAAVAKTGKGALGLHVALQMQPGTLGLVEYAARNNATLGDALRTLARYSEVLAEGATFRLDVDGELARFTYAVTGSPQPPSVVDFVLGYVARIMREGMSPSVVLHEVAFSYPPPADRAPYEAVFQARLRFDAKENVVVLPAVALSWPIQAADPHLHAVLDQQARKLVAELPVTDAFEERVRRLMASELRSGDPTARGLAKKLRMSPRTFQRRLLDAGTTHTKLLDEVRHALSVRLLDQNELTLGEISAALGYSDVSAFRKAFRRWTGQAPRRPGQQDVGQQDD